MGTTNSSYVGIYLTIPSKPRKIKETLYLNKAGETVQTPFDATTGEQNMIIKREFETMVKPWTDFYKYETITTEERQSLDSSEFMVPYYHDYEEGSIFIINDSDNKYHIADEEYQISVDISKIDVQQLLNDFKVEYKAYLDLFEREFGVVNTHFGLVVYAG